MTDKVYLLTSDGLTVADDPVAIVANVQANPLLFRIGIASSLVMFVSVFALIAALHVTVAPANRSLALLGMVLRLPEATLGLVSVIFSLVLSRLASGKVSAAGLRLDGSGAIMPDSAAARIRLACVPAIYGDSDLLPAVVAGGEAAWGAYSYINSLAGIACQMRRLGAGVCMPMLGAARRRGPASRSSSGG